MCYRHLFTLLPILLLLAACSDDNNDDKENIIDKTTHEIAEKAVHSIQDPLDKARNTAIIVEDHSRQLQEQTEEDK